MLPNEDKETTSTPGVALNANAAAATDETTTQKNKEKNSAQPDDIKGSPITPVG